MNGCIIYSEDEDYTLEEKNFLKTVVSKTYNKERIGEEISWDLYPFSDFPSDHFFYILHGKNTSSVFFKKMVDLGIFTRKNILERSSTNLPNIFAVSFNYDLKHLQNDKEEKVKVFKFLTSDNLLSYLKEIILQHCSDKALSEDIPLEEIKEEAEEEIKETVPLEEKNSTIETSDGIDSSIAKNEEVVFSIDHLVSQIKDKGSLKNFKNIEIFSDENPERKILISSSAKESDGHIAFTDLITIIKVCELAGFNKIMFRKK